MNRKMNVLNICLDDCTAKDAMKVVTEFMQSEPVNMVEIVMVDVLMRAAQTEGLKENIEQMDLVIAGEEAILEAAGITDRKKLQEVHNRVFVKMLFQYFRKNHSRMFVLADTQEEAEALQSSLAENYSGIEIVGTSVVPEDESADDMITNRINGAEVECVLASLVSPKQEAFAGRCKNVLNTRMWLGVGKEAVIFPKTAGWKERVKEFLERKILKREVEKEKKKKEPNCGHKNE